MMKSRYAIAILLILLAGSIALNVVLYQQGRAYYLDLNRTRLDPLGLKAFPAGVSTRATDKPLVVFFGDSRAAGWSSPSQVSEEMVFINRGIGAQTTAQTLGRFAAHIQPLQPDILILQVGINDLKTIPLFPGQKKAILAGCKANIEQIVGLSTQNGARVILTTIFPLGQLPIERRPFWSEDVAAAVEEINEFIKTLASDQVTVFDTNSVLANSRGITDPLYSKDFLHLNEKGYGALNQQLVHLLKAASR